MFQSLELILNYMFCARNSGQIWPKKWTHEKNVATLVTIPLTHQPATLQARHDYWYLYHNCAVSYVCKECLTNEEVGSPAPELELLDAKGNILIRNTCIYNQLTVHNHNFSYLNNKIVYSNQTLTLTLLSCSHPTP